MSEILVADDEEAVRRTLRSVLEREGHTVTEAVDGAEALAKLKAARFDLVITDMNMPDVDGLELTRVLRLQSNPPSIIGMTGDDAVNLEVAEILGAKGTLSKPFTPRQLADLVSKVLSEGEED